MRKFYIILTSFLLVSCVDRAYDIKEGSDNHLTLFPGMTLDLVKSKSYETDSLFSFRSCRSTRLNDEGKYELLIPEQSLLKCQLTGEQLINGYSPGHNYVIRTHLELPSVLDADVSKYRISGISFAFQFENGSPFELEVGAKVGIGGEERQLSFPVHSSDCGTLKTACPFELESVPDEIVIRELFVKANPGNVEINESSYLFNLSVQPIIPMTFEAGSTLKCNFEPEAFADDIVYEARTMVFNYKITNQTGFRLKYSFAIPGEPVEITMDEIPSDAVKYPVKMVVRSSDYIQDKKDKLEVSLEAVNDSGKPVSVKKDATLNVVLSGVTFPDGIILR